jgi:hypothetical protein
MNGTDFIKFAIDTLKADPNYSDIDMSESSAFYNMVILPFTVLSKPIYDMNEANLSALKLESMTDTQMDDYASMFFVKRRTENLLTLEISIYLTNTATATEPLIVSTTDQFRTGSNQVFSPIQDYIFAYNVLPTVTVNGTIYKVATIVTSSANNYSQVAEGSIKTSSLLHPLIQFVTNTKSSSSPLTSETNTEFINTIQKAIAQRNNTTSDSLYTNLKLAFPQITDCLSIGHSDPEMQRDIAVAGKTWSGHFGGMTDIYIRTPLTPVTATISATDIGNGYKFKIQRYKGYDWSATDNASPNPLSLTPWILLQTNDPLPITPVVLIDWTGTSISNTTITLDTNGYPKYSIKVLPDPLEKSYGKNYRYSPYENIEITIYTDLNPGGNQTVTLKYYTLSNIEEIQSFVNSSANRVLCANNLVKSFIPVEIKSLNITYDSRYTVNETQWKTTIANLINNWSLPEPIRLTTLLKDFPAPTRIDEIWYDSNANNLPYTTDVNGIITGTNGSTGAYPCYATMLLENIDGSHQYYLSTRQLYPLVSNGISTSYRTCRYFIDPTNISFIKGSW